MVSRGFYSRLESAWRLDQLTKHQGEEGSRHSLILSLLCDHFLIQHPTQSDLLKNKQSGLSVGCLIDHLKIDSLGATISSVIHAPNAEQKLLEITNILQSRLSNRASLKHMSGKDLGRMEETASLKNKKAA